MRVRGLNSKQFANFYFLKAYLIGHNVRPFLIWSVVVAFGSENDRCQAGILSSEVVVMWD